MIPLMPQTFPQTQEERLHTHRHKQAQCSFTFPPHKASLGTPIPLRSKKRRGKRKRTKPKAPSAKATYLALPSKVKPLKRSKSPRTLMALAVKSHHQMLASSSTSSSSPSSQPLPPPPPAATSSSCLPADQPSPAKRKRRPPGTPDPDAEVVALSPRTLLESDRYVCEICGQGFQREQNLQMHRRRHKVPWRLVKRAATTAGTTDQDGGGGGTASAGGTGGGAAAAASTVPRKRVFVCPEPSCLHHDPAHALGDLVGIKKHFRRKHGGRRQWVCARCAKGYAVQSDYKAHLKTCGTRGHSCDCGRVFSRVESFIEHQDACNSGRMRAEAVPSTVALPVIRPAVLSRPPPPPSELQLLPAAATKPPLAATPVFSATTHAATATTTTKLELSIGRDDHDHEEGEEEEAMRRAMEEKAAADGERERAREEAAAAERALEEARRARHRARGELEAACALRDHAARLLAQVTCHACRQQRSFADAAGVHVVVSMGVAGGEGHGGSAAAREALMVRARGGLGL